MEERLAKIFSVHKESGTGKLIPILQEIQAEFGYLPEEALVKVAEFVHISESKVFGVASFYTQFRFTPTGKIRVTVCRGTACHVRGGARILREVEKHLDIRAGESTPDLEYCLETAACFGACALAPVVIINGKVHGRMTPTKAKEMLNKETQ